MSRAKPRNRQHGNTMVLALIVMSALATLGTLTVVSVQSSLKASTADRSQALALYAAESGAAIIMDYLRYHFDPTPLPGPAGGTPWFRPKAWGAMVKPLNAPSVSLNGTEPTSGAKPGTANNPFLGDGIVAWYETTILNNKDDFPPPALDGPPPVAHPYPFPVNGYLEGVDYDGRVIIQITGHGPQEAIAILEVEVQWPIQQTIGVPPPTVGVPPVTFPAPGSPTLTLLGWHVVNF